MHLTNLTIACTQYLKGAGVSLQFGPGRLTILPGHLAKMVKLDMLATLPSG